MEPVGLVLRGAGTMEEETLACRVLPLWEYKASVLRLFSVVVIHRGYTESGLGSEVIAVGPGRMLAEVEVLGQLQVVHREEPRVVHREEPRVELLEEPMPAVWVVVAEAEWLDEQLPPTGARVVAGQPRRTAWPRRSVHAAADCTDMPWPCSPGMTQTPGNTSCHPMGTRSFACPVGNQLTTCPRRLSMHAAL